MYRLLSPRPTHALLAAAISTLPMVAQIGPAVPAYATRVVAFDTLGDAGGGTFSPSNALGAPTGGGVVAGSVHVHSLGIGGSLTLGFDVTIVDGSGADFVVAENPFFSGPAEWSTFAEVAFVEVSTDGVTFARFPTAYVGAQVEPGGFGSVRVGSYHGLVGGTPVYPLTANSDPRDLVIHGGDAFDLADLIALPEVVSGVVDLQAIHEVRLVDVRSGIDLDARGTPIRDAGLGSADVDGVVVLNAAEYPSVTTGPVVTLMVPVTGQLRIDIHDPNGLGDIARVSTSLFGVRQPAVELLGSLTPTVLDATRVRFELLTPVPPGIWFQLGVSVTDSTGSVSGARRARPDQ